MVIHRELARRLREEIKDPRLVPVSITRLTVSKDLGRATISYMPLGGGEVTDELQAAMADVGRQLRGPIGRQLRTRRTPELVFVPDTHTEEAIRLTSLLNRIGQELRDQEEDVVAEEDPEGWTEPDDGAETLTPQPAPDASDL